MKTLLRKLLARLRVAPFDGRWTPQILEQNAIDTELPVGDPIR